MLSEKEVNIQSYIEDLSNRSIEYKNNVAYIMPEGSESGVDLLNEYAPDLRKDFTESAIDSIVVKGSQHNYIGRRSADIILPLIWGIPFSIFANFITDWIRGNVPDGKIVELKYIKEDNGNYKEITVKGNRKDVEKILKQLMEN